MRPIFEFDEILQQDIHEDGLNESSIEQQMTPLTPVLSTINTERSRTYSDSSLASIDGDDHILTIRSKKQFNKNHLGTNSLSTSLINNEPQPLFSNDIELYGTQLVNPLLFLSSFALST
jgi:hypothetical protein